MYGVLNKDTMKYEILLHLSMAKRGYVSKSNLLDVIQCVITKRKNVKTTSPYWFIFLG